MAVNASAASITPRELPPAGTHIARCVGLVEIGTVTETYQDGKVKTLPKLRLTWELPTALKDFGTGKGPQPFLVSANYTVSLSEKANLRKMLQSWRGVEFTPQELEKFNVENVLGAPCLLGIIHKTSKSGKPREEIVSVSKIPDGFTAPPQITPKTVLSYDSFNQQTFDALPDFLKDDMRGTPEYKSLFQGSIVSAQALVSQAQAEANAFLAAPAHQSRPVTGFVSPAATAAVPADDDLPF